jgi:dihydrodipicolinate synthase/N-acetylneuraminate lyase
MGPDKLSLLRKGVVIPAHPLALTSSRKLDERRQRALTRYYLAAGAGGLAVGVHTTQFAIRDVGLLKPVLELAAEEEKRHKPLSLKIAGICGPTTQATAEAALARDLGYDIGLLSLGALKDANEDALIAHAKAVGAVIPLFGFYLQPAVGGRALPYSFWRRLAELPNVVGIKMAPFNRYQTLDVLRAVVESGRAKEIALYTGNDDNILLDLLTEFRFGGQRLRIVGGLLGHWSVWTRKAVELLDEVHRASGPTPELLTRAAQITDSNAAFFDAANAFRGGIAGLHDVLRRQGLLEGVWCLDPKEGLSPGQKEEIDRVYRAYPALNDDAFIETYRDLWLGQ